jgi:hypothetical protein
MMKSNTILANSGPVCMFKPGIMLICLALTSTNFGFDIRFTSSKSALAIPFELADRYVDNHIFVHVGINGSQPLSFILDTGASHTVINLRNARSLGLNLQQVGKVEGGTGDDPLDAYLITDEVSFTLPGVVLSSSKVVAVALDKTQECVDPVKIGDVDLQVGSSQKAKEGTSRIVDGILGREFFSSFVVEIDYQARLINLYDPLTYRYTGGGTSFPIDVDPHYVFVRAQVKARGRPAVTARLIVDTGGGTDLWLTKQFTEAHGMLPPEDKLTMFTDCGINGSQKVKSRVGTLEAIELGSFRVRHPSTVFYQQQTVEGADGLLGNTVLRNYKVIFDYSRKRMILESPRWAKSAR